jgi:type II restriction enzyme
MKLGFKESQLPFTSGSQNARVWTEAWVKTWAYCTSLRQREDVAVPEQ